MHGRRNVGNGYRSGSIGMGMSGSRMSPERPMRGHGFYGSDHQHRGFNRGYGRGRGRSKSYQNQLHPPLPPPPMQRRSGGGGSVFMEAGRLAAEYLVSQGVLPQTVLSSKWQNGNFSKQGGEFQSSRSQEAARADVSAPAADKRRYVDGYSSAGSRNNLKGRKSHRYDSDFGRSGSWSERSKAFEAETGDDSVSGHREEHAEDIASSVQRSVSGEFMRKREGAGDSESVLDKYNLQDEAQSKTGSSSAGKEIMHDCEISKISEGSSSLSAGSAGEMKGRTGGNGGENENQTAVEDASIHQHFEEASIRQNCEEASIDQPCEGASIHQHCAADESFTKSGIDLATLCKFEKVPTRTRSSLTAKGPKLYLSQNIKESSHNSGLIEEDQTQNRCDSTVDEDLALVQFVENSKCHRSKSFPSSNLRDNSEIDSGLELPSLHRTHSMGKGGEKRAAEGCDLEERAKRQRGWVPLPVSEANERFNIFKTDPEEEEEEKSSFNRRLIDGAVGKTVSHENLVNNSTRNSIHKGKAGPGYAEEHQLFPASFKICDLNLGGGSDVNDAKRESGQAGDYDLSISSSSKSLEFSTSTRMSNGKEIEVIDLDNDDSPEVVKSRNDPRRKQEAAPYMGIGDVPDYNEGLMMVEYLDSFGNIPPIDPGISTVPQNNDVALQDREGALGNDQAPNNTDDDAIFMSLGEIPLTFLQAWDQPPARGYEKPF